MSVGRTTPASVLDKALMREWLSSTSKLPQIPFHVGTGVLGNMSITLQHSNVVYLLVAKRLSEDYGID